MVLDMSNKYTGSEFSVPTASSALTASRWYTDSALARWAGAGQYMYMHNAERDVLSGRFFGNTVVTALARGVKAVALTLHDVFRLVGINVFHVFTGDVLKSHTEDGVFSSVPLGR